MIAEAYITQDEIIQGLQASGYNVNRHTLEYWRSQGLIPQLTRFGREYYYSQDDIIKIRYQCDASKRQQDVGVILTLALEGDTFQVTRVESYRDGNRLVTLLHMLNGGILVKSQDFKEGLQWLQQLK